MGGDGGQPLACLTRRFPRRMSAGSATHQELGLTQGAAAIRRPAVKPGDSGLAARLADAVEGEVLFDAFTRGRYSTDASLYQVEPLGVVRPKRSADIDAALGITRQEGVPVPARGGGTSQAAQTLHAAPPLATPTHLKRLL